MGKLQRMQALNAGAAAESIGVRKAAPPPVLKIPESQAAPRLKRDETGYLIPLKWIDRDPEQPRKEFSGESIEQLANSLRESGQLQPCVVRPGKAKDTYVLVCGERRWRAAAVAGLETLRCRVEVGRDRAEVLADQLAENLQRDDMNPVELADALGRLQGEHGWASRKIAERLGISQSAVSRSLALGGLAEGVRGRVRDGRLAASSAVLLGRVEDHAEQEELARLAVTQGMTRDQVEDLVRLRLEGYLAPSDLSHGDSTSGPGVLSHGDSAAPPAAPVLSHGDSTSDPRVLSHGDSVPAPRPSAAVPVPTVLVVPPASKPGAAAEGKSASTVMWGCDVTAPVVATVTVEMYPGTPRSMIVAALRAAIDAAQFELSGAAQFPIGSRVKLVASGHVLQNREGIVVGPAPEGCLKCEFTNAGKKPLIWDCAPAILQLLARGPDPRGKDRRRP